MITSSSRKRPSAAALLCLLTVFTACEGETPQQVDVETAISTGGMLYESEGCANCHGPEGLGDVGPDLSDVLDTFPACETQVEWVSLGSARWAQDRGSGYGATNKPLRGGMPGFGSRLAEDQIRKIASFTRSRFAGGDEISIVRDCLASSL